MAASPSSRRYPLVWNRGQILGLQKTPRTCRNLALQVKPASRRAGDPTVKVAAKGLVSLLGG